MSRGKIVIPADQKARYTIYNVTPDDGFSDAENGGNVVDGKGVAQPLILVDNGFTTD